MYQELADGGSGFAILRPPVALALRSTSIDCFRPHCDIYATYAYASAYIEIMMYYQKSDSVSRRIFT